jgi:hypothetical protein
MKADRGDVFLVKRSAQCGGDFFREGMILTLTKADLGDCGEDLFFTEKGGGRTMVWRRQRGQFDYFDMVFGRLDG